VTLPRFLVDTEALRSARTVLTGPELHHLRVRRVRVGSELYLADGRGQQRRGMLVALDRHRAVIQLTDDRPVERESPLHMVLAQAVLKGNKLDLVIEKATELGISELLLFSGERTVGRVSSDRHLRWQRIARSAAKQCQRSTVPGIVGPVPFTDLLARHEGALRLFFWEESPPDGLTAVREAHPEAGSVLAAVGPEGGFSPAEATRAAAAGFRLIGLAPRILRAETAALVAVTLCQFLWGDFGRRVA
jgi:16S rRNA (uracil1498-N3)-methyltransferase